MVWFCIYLPRKSYSINIWRLDRALDAMKIEEQMPKDV